MAQPYPSSGDVLPGDPASYLVWVWSVNADSSTVSVTATATANPAGNYLGSPSFTICPSGPNTAPCTIESLPTGQTYELLASVPVTSDAEPGTDITLTATATTTATGQSPSSSATDVVASAPEPSPSSNIPVPPLISIPPIPGTGVSPTNPSALFPPVSGSLGLPSAAAQHVGHLTDTAYAVPVDPLLLGAQILGLVALAAAVTIAIVRLSLRRTQSATPRPADPGRPPPTS